MSSSTHLLTVGDGALNPFTIPGTTRTYNCPTNGTLLVVNDDALILENAGWIDLCGRCGPRSGGTTANRPATPSIGHIYADTTTGYLVIWGGPISGWRNCSTGATG